MSVSEKEIQSICSVCEIYGYCHEFMKGNVKEWCCHYKGIVPEGFILHEGYVKRFHPQNWKYYCGYVYEFQNDKKRWLKEWEIRRENKEFFD